MTAPDAPPIEKPRPWFTGRKISIFVLLLLGFLSYVAYALKETYLVTAAHSGVGIIVGQLQLLAARSAPEPLALETAARLLNEEGPWKVTTDGSGRYYLMQIGDRFVIYTQVMREGFALKQVVVFGSQGNGSKAIPEGEFLARKKTEDFLRTYEIRDVIPGGRSQSRR